MEEIPRMQIQRIEEVTEKNAREALASGALDLNSTLIATNWRDLLGAVEEDRVKETVIYGTAEGFVLLFSVEQEFDGESVTVPSVLMAKSKKIRKSRSPGGALKLAHKAGLYRGRISLENWDPESFHHRNLAQTESHRRRLLRKKSQPQ